MSDFDWELPYPSQRMPVLAGNAVATSQPLAVQAGIEMLRRGGNAVDAALAAAIALVVVEPTGCGLGADAFAIVWDGEELHGLNASGRSPAALSPDPFKGASSMPMVGWDPVTVPGAVSAWVALSERFGRLDFAELFEAAARYAAEGYLVSPVTARLWGLAAGMYEGIEDFAVFLPGGRAPLPGERFRFPELAKSLEEIAVTRGESFYRGRLAGEIEAHARATGGLLTAADLDAHEPVWAEPISISYRDRRVHELPPNGQGLAALVALGILEELGVGDCPVDSADSLHLQIEAMKLALADARRFVADPEAMDVSADALLDRAYLSARSRLVDRERARDPGHGEPNRGDTVYLTAADDEGRMVSFIQSNYMMFGSGIVVPGTGISLQNRGACFSLEPGHPNQVAGGKRPFHTIIPAFVTREGRAEMSFGVMGGSMQAQGHVQVMVRSVDYAQNPQAAIDAPRWQVSGGLEVAVEPGVGPEVRAELARRGHVVSESDPAWFGGAQALLRLDEGYLAASDPRKDGHAAGY